MPTYQSSVVRYRVTISASGLGGAAPADGFIDHLTVEQRVAAGDTAPTTLAQTQAKERANLRYTTLVKSLGILSDMYVNNQITTGATATTAATSIQFDVEIAHGDESFANEGLTSAAALKRLVARAIMIGQTHRTEYNDPTTTAAIGDNAPATAARRGDVVADLVMGALTASLTTAEAAITVTNLTAEAS